MPSNDANLPPWKQSGGDKKAGPRRGWQPDPNRGGGEQRSPSGFSWQRLIAMMLVGLFVLLAILVIIHVWPRPALTFAFYGAGYELDLSVPHNAWGMNGLAKLEDLANTSQSGPKGLFRKNDERLNSEGSLSPEKKELLFENLDRAAGQVVLVMLSLHGIGEEDKTLGPSLLLPQKDNRPGERLPMRELIRHLSSGELRKKKVVLILDTVHFRSAPGRGVLHNDFVRQLKALDSEIDEAENLVVLCCCDEGERSWFSEGFGRTYYSHYLWEALRGLPAWGKKETGIGRVTAALLHEYVAEKVSAVVSRTRNEAMQRPLLLPLKRGLDRASRIELTQRQDVKASTYEKRLLKSSSEENAAHSARWERALALQQGELFPATYRPQQWRRYREWLLRYEELLRAGSPLARVVAEKLTDLEEKELKRPAPGRASSESDSTDAGLATLSMVEALGPGVGVGQDLIERQNRHKSFLDRLNKDPTTLKAALQALAPRPGEQRPAESHFALMYQHLYHGPEWLGEVKDKPEAHLALALRVRRRAERAAVGLGDERDDRPAYSEWVRPWIAEAVREADAARRRGEDLLYGPSSGWEEAEKELKKADVGYRKVQEQAAGLRAALDVTDRLMADLPYYARWTVGRLGQDEDALTRELIDQALGLAKEVREKTPSEAVAAELARRARACEDRSKRLRELFQKSWNDLRNDQQNTQPVRGQLEALLATPLIVGTGEERSALIHRLQEVAHHLEAQTVDEKKEYPQIDVGRVPREARQTTLQEIAFHEGPLTDLGADLSRPEGKLWMPRSEVWPTEKDEGLWQGRFVSMGISNLARRDEMVRRINEITSRGREHDPATVISDLKKADRALRVLDAAATTGLSTPDATEECRAILMYDLLVDQAERAYLDHWFNEVGQPYYRTTGEEFLKEARRWIVGGLPEGQQGARLTRLTSVQERLRGKELVLVAPAGPLHITSERQRGVEHTLAAPLVFPPGYPVLWSDLRSADKLRLVGDSQRRVFQALTPGKEVNYPLTLDNTYFEERSPPPTPEARRQKVAVRGLFRGQLLSKETEVLIHRVPHITWTEYEKKRRANIGIFGEKATFDRYATRNGKIAIVLDYSGSMDPKDAPRPRRYEQALEALKEVLSDPELAGVTLSLWVFGYEVGSEMSGRPELVKRDLFPPRKWDPSKGIKELMETLKPLKPYDLTPLVRTMADAFETDLASSTAPTGSEGFKTLLVLTDGKDTRFCQAKDENSGDAPTLKGINASLRTTGDPKYNPGSKKTIPSFLVEKFGQSDVMINMVFFQAGSELDEAKEQFSVIEDRSKFKIPGRITTADKIDQLKASLREGLRQSLRCFLWRGPGNLLPPSNGLELRRHEVAWFEKLEPEEHLLQVQGLLRQAAPLKEGDTLLLSLAQAGAESRLRRALLRDIPGFEQLPLAQDSEKKWALTPLQSSIDSRNTLEMLLALENQRFFGKPEEDPEKKGVLRQTPPDLVWYDVAPKDGDRSRLALRWSSTAGYPGHTRALDVHGWPRGNEGAAPPVVKAYWAPGPTPMPFHWAQTLRSQGNRIVDLPPNPIHLEGMEIILESVTLENRSVRYSGEETAPRISDSPCLVVRVRCPGRKEAPVLARLSELEPRGSEHLWYDEAEGYTGIFWLKNATLPERLTLELLSLDAFRKKPPFAATLEKLPAPGDIRRDKFPGSVRARSGWRVDE